MTDIQTAVSVAEWTREALHGEVKLKELFAMGRVLEDARAARLARLKRDGGLPENFCGRIEDLD